jgi:hypothetical protein
LKFPEALDFSEGERHVGGRSKEKTVRDI